MLTKATRVHDGAESNQDVCEKGHRFGVSFPKGPPQQPDWPPPEEIIDYRK